MTVAKVSRAGRSPLYYSGLAALILLTLASGVYFAGRSGTDPNTYSNDFNVYYFAAREILGGRDPYQNSLGAWTPYLYPPLLAELMAPFAVLPLPVASYLWFLISALSAIAAVGLSARLAGSRALVAVVTVAVLFRFLLDNFDLGQVNTIVAALSVASVYLYSNNRKCASAIALALAASIKLTPAALIFYHLARGRLRFAGGCILLLLAMNGLSFLPFGGRAPEAFLSFVNRTVRNEQGFDLAYTGNQSLRGVVARVVASADNDLEQTGAEVPRSPAHPLALLLSIALVAIAIPAARRAPTEVAAAAPFFSLMVLISPLSWKAHFVLLVLPVAFLAGRLLRGRNRRQSLLLAASLAGAFALFNLTSPKVIGLRAAEWSDAHSLIFAGALVIYFASVWQAVRGFVNLRLSESGDDPV